MIVQEGRAPFYVDLPTPVPTDITQRNRSQCSHATGNLWDLTLGQIGPNQQHIFQKQPLTVSPAIWL